jgi:pSer/pThr/pTyr-binding forkhead associated (FHA) protein
VGRAEICDVGLFGDPGVESLHAPLLRRGDGYVIEDVGTAEGTFVNELRVTEPTPLRDGDAIRLGKCVPRFGERRTKPRERSEP